MNKIILSQYSKDKWNAGPKAKTDIEKIISQYFDTDVITLDTPKNISVNLLSRYLFFLKKIFIIRKYAKKNNIVFIQHPFTNKYKLLSNAEHVICFIHDIDGLRRQDENFLNLELAFLKKCDILIVHNLKMKKYLVEHGVKEEKIFVLEVFDYLSELKEVTFQRRSLKENISLVYTGNLDKAPFLFQLDEQKMRFNLNVYGIKSKEIKNSKINYKGAFDPNELYKYIEGDLGLVWDGDLDESDENLSFKNYTKYNNPHKLSFYLSVGLPVIVWKKSAISNFIIKNNIGYVINNLYEINDIDFSDYSEKAKNAWEIGKKVRDGYYTKRTVINILEYLKNI
jgi:hypothetical protein